MDFKDVAGPMLVVELLDRNAATDQTSEAMLQLIGMAAKFCLDGTGWLQIVEGDFQRAVHTICPQPVSSLRYNARHRSAVA
jgi:hypothetical protein